MDGYRHHAHHAPHMRTSHLTQLYSDTKKSALTSVDSSTHDQFSSLHRKYKIQKDRLITWGLAWSDEEKGADGDIDDAVAKAGLTETVDSVLRNIKEVTEEAERLRQACLPVAFGATAKPATFDQARYQDLLQDLTTSIDTLYDLSRSRRALARGEHPSFKSTSTEQSNAEKPLPIRKSLIRAPSFASSEITLVNPPSFQKPPHSPYVGLPPLIKSSSLRIPPEGPPPYESLGVPSAARVVAQLIRSKVSEGVQNRLGSGAAEVQVLVEYANFDPAYRDTHVPVSLQRLEALVAYLQPMRAESQTNLSLVGYFEDETQPRIGLVYDLPYCLQNKLQGTAGRPAQRLSPTSLLKLVQKGSKQAPAGDSHTPPLEDRFRLALGLAEQLQRLHTCGVAHGNINSSSAIFTVTAEDALLSQVRSPLWASFDVFSKCFIDNTRRAMDLNVYRHPRDEPQTLNRTPADDIRFDLYSFALVLVEIGLWAPISDFFKPKYTLVDFKLRLEKIYIPKLAFKCGTAYMRAVQTCFSAAERGEASKLTMETIHGPILSKLRRCCLLDDDDLSTDSLSPGGSFAAAAAIPYGDKAYKDIRQTSPDLSPLGQRLDPNDSTRMPNSSYNTSYSTSHSTSYDTPHRLASMPNLANISSPMPSQQQIPRRPVSRRPSTRSQLSQRSSVSQVTDRVSRHIADTPSFQEYKRKIVLIQQKWRERCAKCRQGAGQSFREEGGFPQATTEDDHDAPLGQAARLKRQCFPTLPLPRAVLDQWEKGAMFQLAKLCEKALKGLPESSSVELTMYGESPETARPTYLITCKSTAKIKQVLKRHFKHDPTLCDVRVKKTVHEIRRCRRQKRHGESAARRVMAPASGLDKAANPDYQERPLCGASIGAYRDEEHLPPVSFGGIVMVDDTAYGMSVHHMLEPPDDDEDEEDSEAGAEDTDSDTSSVRSFDNISIYSHSDDESTVRPPSTLPETDTVDQYYEGDLPGVAPSDMEDIDITQPALDDAIDCDLHVDVDDEDEDADEDSGIDSDHLLSYRLGQVYASSGLKRTAGSGPEGFKSISQSLPQEIDWALFRLEPPRIHPFNVVRGGTTYCAIGSSSGDSFPVAVKQSSELACAKVHCLGRTSGLAGGVVSSTMELVKIHGRDTYSASWTVDGDFGVGGDSGAWVICNDDGRVCGHVLASKQGRTYICPMELLLSDIKDTLKARTVVLPTSAAAEIGKMSRVEAERALADAVGKIRLVASDNEAGGVPLPTTSARPSMGTSRRFERCGNAVQTAG